MGPEAVWGWESREKHGTNQASASTACLALPKLMNDYSGQQESRGRGKAALSLLSLWLHLRYAGTWLGVPRFNMAQEQERE